MKTLSKYLYIIEFLILLNIILYNLEVVSYEDGMFSNVIFIISLLIINITETTRR